MKSVVFKLFIVVFVVFLSSCDDGYIEYPKINRELTLSKNSVNVAKDSEVIVEIVSGVGSYSVSSKDKTIAAVELIGKKIHIDAVGEGETAILVIDNQTKLKKKIIVSIDKINFEEFVLVVVSDKPYKFGSTGINFKKSFEVGKYEVTVNQFCNFMNKTDKYRFNKNNSKKLRPLKFKNIHSAIVNDTIIYSSDIGKKNFPVVSVDWKTAKEYCESKGGRLPSETEWEYAAQGGIHGPGHGNEILTEEFVFSSTWVYGNSNYVELHDVQSKQANALGIHNMLGNVSEWCEDNLTMNVDKIPTDGSAFHDAGLDHVLRGGSSGDLYLGSTIHSTRFVHSGDHAYLGFRVFKTVDY